MLLFIPWSTDFKRSTFCCSFAFRCTTPLMPSNIRWNVSHSVACSYTIAAKDWNVVTWSHIWCPADEPDYLLLSTAGSEEIYSRYMNPTRKQAKDVVSFFFCLKSNVIWKHWETVPDNLVGMEMVLYRFISYSSWCSFPMLSCLSCLWPDISWEMVIRYMGKP